MDESFFPNFFGAIQKDLLSFINHKIKNLVDYIDRVAN